MTTENIFALVILWIFFACFTFGCIAGGDTPKQWIKPNKSETLKAAGIAIIWPVFFFLVIVECCAEKTSWLNGWR